MDVWEEPRTADKLEEYLTEGTDVDTTLSMIPSLFGISDKATYLAYRAMGLSPAQSLRIMELDEDYIDYWRNHDPDFLEFEKRNIVRLQRECSLEIIRLGFIKNMALLVAKDAQIIRAGLTDFNMLTKREFEYLTKVRSHYTPNDLYNLEKALSPEKHKDNLVINLEWGNSVSPRIEEDQLELGGYHEDRIPLHDSQEEHEVLSLPEGNQVRVCSE